MNLQNMLVQLVNAGLQVYLAIKFYSLFSKQKCTSKLMIPLGSILSIFMAIGLYFFRGNVILYIFTLLPTLILTFCFENSIISKIVSFSLYNAVEAVSELIVGSLLTIFAGVSFGNIIGAAYIIGMIMSKTIAFIIIIFVRIFKSRKNFELYKKGSIKVCMFPLASFTTTVVQYFMLKDDLLQNIQLSYLLLISYTVLVISNIIVFDYIDSIYTRAADKERIAVANEIIVQQKEQYKALIDHNREIAQIQHDNKHLFFGLIAEMKKGNHEAVMTGLTGAYEICEKEITATDSIIEAIVNIKKKEAREKGINIDYEYRHLRDLKISPMDIAIVLGNALDNAIEACNKVDSKEDITIDLFVALKGETLVILIKNPVKDNVDVANLISKKENAELHGFGVLSMKQIAKKYDGEVVFKCEDNVFSTTIFMCNTKL